MLGVGSCAEYDWTVPLARPRGEEDPRRPASLYGMAKRALHDLLQPFCEAMNIALVWARLFHLYGPFEAPQRLVPSLLAALRDDRAITLNNAAAVRDFMHVADAGRALAHLLSGDLTGAVNVASA